MLNRRGFALFVAVIATAAACGIGDRAHRADVIYKAHEMARGAKTAAGMLQIELTPQETPGATTTTALVPGGGTIKLAATVGLDFSAGSAAIGVVQTVGGTVEDAEGLEAAVGAANPSDHAAASEAAVSTLFHGGTAFVRRGNARASERRVWAKLDYSLLPDDEPRPSTEELEGDRSVRAIANTINPAFLVDLALGVLPGSAESAGTSTINGQRLTKYETNVSLDRASTELDLDDDDTATRTLMFRLLGIRDDVRPAQFWIDSSGRLRRIRLEFIQRMSRTERSDLIVVLDLAGYGTAVRVVRPTNDETIELERYGRLIRTAVPTTG